MTFGFFRRVMIMTQAGLVEASSFFSKKLCHEETSVFYLKSHKKWFSHFYVTHLCSYWCTLRNISLSPAALFGWMEGSLCAPSHPLKELCMNQELHSNQAQLQIGGLSVFSRAQKVCVIAYSQCKIWLILKAYIFTLLN